MNLSELVKQLQDIEKNYPDARVRIFNQEESIAANIKRPFKISIKKFERIKGVPDFRKQPPVVEFEWVVEVLFTAEKL